MSSDKLYSSSRREERAYVRGSTRGCATCLKCSTCLEIPVARSSESNTVSPSPLGDACDSISEGGDRGRTRRQGVKNDGSMGRDMRVHSMIASQPACPSASSCTAPVCGICVHILLFSLHRSLIKPPKDGVSLELLCFSGIFTLP